jgi:Oxaloacetate decarboxylase, gamma chain.
MKKILLTLAVSIASTAMFAQGAKNIRINEVLTNNTASLQDGLGERLPWVELANTSYSTYDVRGMFITTNRKVLDKSLSAPERIELMSPIPNGEERTQMSGRQHLVFFLNSNPANSSLHLDAKANAGEPLWIALYDGNGIDLIDSVSVPALDENKSYARIKDGNQKWDIKPAEAVTPGIGNFIEINESKIDKLKKNDPHGFGITVLSMGIVFACLALLYVFFTLFGKYVIAARKEKKAKQKISEYPKMVINEANRQDNATPDEIAVAVATLAINEEMATYAAVIALALKQYQDDVHDIESDIITIKPHKTLWHNTFNNF